MAIEDGYELALTLSEAAKDTAFGQTMDIQGALSSYQSVSFTPPYIICSQLFSAAYDRLFYRNPKNFF